MLRCRPLVLITLAFAAGILFMAYAPSLVWVLLLSALLALLATVRVFNFSFNFSKSDTVHGIGGSDKYDRFGRKRSSTLTVLLALVFALFGSARYLAGNFVATNDVSHLAPLFLTIRGVVASDVTAQPPQHAGQAVVGKFILAAHQVGTDATGRQIAISGQVAVRVPLAPVASVRSTRSARSSRSGRSIQASQAERAEQETAVPHYGDVLTIRGRLERPQGARNPGGFDYQALLQRQGIYATLTVRRFDDWHFSSPVSERSPLPGNPILALAYRARNYVLQHGRATHTHERAGVLNGILLGDRGDLPGMLNEDFERTGTSHVLATAGLHVGLVVGLLLAFLRVIRIARKPALVAAFLALILYALMAGGRPSVTRAVIMASVVLIGILVEREPYLPNALGIAALGLLCANPQNLFEPGFQLSFATVITIVLLMPLATHVIGRVGKWIQDDWMGAKLLRFSADTLVSCFFLAVTAFLGSAPLIAYYFNDVSLVSIVANTVVVPVIALIIALGFGAVVLSALHPLCSLPLDRLLDMLLTWVINVVHTCSTFPNASLPAASPPAWFLIAYYTALWIVAWGAGWYKGEADRKKDVDKEDNKNDA